MGFDAENIVNPFEIRVKNYHETSDRQEKQADKILRAVSLLKEASPSQLYNYFKKTNGGNELYPLTSIRARMTEMAKDTSTKPAKLVFVKEVKSELYDSTEASYKIKEFQHGLF